jgi:glycosyltransferase involved in cell wall biosynthesis
MSGPVVSVLMAACNAEAFLTEAVESVLGQGFGDLEFIAIDDGSTDGTSTILSDYARRDSRVHLLRNESNVGLARSLNRGLDLARGQYVARQDADDISLPDRLGTQVAFMDGHADVDICGSWLREIGAAAPVVREYARDDAHLRCELLFRSPLAHPTVMLRREALARHGLRYDEAFLYAQDYALWTAAAPHVGFANIPEPLVLYRVHPLGASVRKHEEQDAYASRVRRAGLARFGGDFSEGEFRLHDVIGARAHQGSRETVKAAEGWLRKLQDINARLKAYPEPAFAHVLAEEWRYLCDRASYRGLGAGLWALRTYFASPLSSQRPRGLRAGWKAACWLTHGLPGRRTRERIRKAPSANVSGPPKNGAERGAP